MHAFVRARLLNPNGTHIEYAIYFHTCMCMYAAKGVNNYIEKQKKPMAKLMLVVHVSGLTKGMFNMLGIIRSKTRVRNRVQK